MSYHGHRNIEQSISEEVQAQPLESNFSKGASYATPSEAAFNDVYAELRGSSHLYKKGFSGGEPNTLSELQGGGVLRHGAECVESFEQLKQLGLPGGAKSELKQLGDRAKDAELKHLEPGGAGKYGINRLGAAEESGAHAAGQLANKIEFGKNAEDSGMVLSKKHGIGYGESFAQKAERREDWDSITNNLKLGIGMALGPVGAPLVIDALRHQMSSSKSGMGESSSSIMQSEMIQRGKMLKSWKSIDE